MGKLITLSEMTQYVNRTSIVLSEGTIVTPSALDWAREHQLVISFGNKGNDDEKKQLLEQVTMTVLKKVKLMETAPTTDDMMKMISAALVKMGNTVE